MAAGSSYKHLLALEAHKDPEIKKRVRWIFLAIGKGRIEDAQLFLEIAMKLEREYGPVAIAVIEGTQDLKQTAGLVAKLDEPTAAVNRSPASKERCESPAGRPATGVNVAGWSWSVA